MIDDVTQTDLQSELSKVLNMTEETQLKMLANVSTELH